MEETPIQVSGVTPFPALPPASKKSFVAKIITGIIVLIVLAVGTCLATRVWDPVWSPFRPKPEKVISQMTDNMARVKSNHSELKMEIDIKSQQSGKVTIVSTGDSDVKDPNNIKSQGSFDLSAGTGLTGETASLKGEFRIIGKDIYFNLDKAEGLIQPVLLESGIDLEKIKNQWVKISAEDISGGKITEQSVLQNEPQKILEESKIYTVKKQLPDEKIEGQKMYHYLLLLNKEEIVKVFKKIIEESIKKSSETQGDTTSVFLTGMVENVLSEFLDKLGDIEIDVLIGKKDNLLYKFSLEKTLDLQKFGTGISGTAIIKINIENSKFNSPVVVESPASFKTWEEVLKLLAEQKIKTDMEQLKVFAGLIFYTNSKRGYLDFNCKNSMIKPVCDDIRVYAGSEPVIRQSLTKYCAYSQIPSIAKCGATEKCLPDYWCIDSTGKLLKTSINPSLKNYCTGKTFVCPANQ